MARAAERRQRKSATLATPSKTNKPNRLRISIIGAGRMGTALGLTLRREGHHIQLVVNRHAASARRAAGAIGGDAIPSTPRQLPNHVKKLAESDLLLISTPDDALESVADQIAGLIRLAQSGSRQRNRRRFALHTSGALSSDALEPLKSLGFAVASFHPLVAIAHAGTAQDSFSGVHVCLEGQRAAVQIGRSLARDLGGHSFTIASGAKPLYHAAAVMTSGHVVALFDLATEMLLKCGLSQRQAWQILAPLLASTAANLGSNSPARALTGPLARGDIATARKHLAAMETNKLSEAAALYSALGRRALRLAAANRDRGPLDEIAKLLSR